MDKDKVITIIMAIMASMTLSVVLILHYSNESDSSPGTAVTSGVNESESESVTESSETKEKEQDETPEPKPKNSRVIEPFADRKPIAPHPVDQNLRMPYDGLQKSVVNAFTNEWTGDVILSSPDDYKVFLDSIKDKLDRVLEVMGDFLEQLGLDDVLFKHHARTMLDVITIVFYNKMLLEFKYDDETPQEEIRRQIMEQLDSLKNIKTFTDPLETVVTASFVGFKLNYFPVGSISFLFKHAATLNLSGTGLNIPIRMFSHIGPLEKLILSKSNLTKLDFSNITTPLKNLQTLNVSKNNITEIVGHSINRACFPTLEKIVVDNGIPMNKMKTIFRWGIEISDGS